jgi:Restriction endonuclease
VGAGGGAEYMTKAGLLSSPKRGLFQITERGQQVLGENPPVINVAFLEKFDEFVEFRNLRRDKPPTEEVTRAVLSSDESTPEEALEGAYQSLRSDLSSEILDTVKGCSPAFFEQLVVDLIVKMGYGGSRKEAGQAIGQSGDEGIDGIIKEDRLGLDIIYIQAKRWEAVVGRPEIQKFAGALQGQRARKGIFITTSSFSREAIDYVRNIDTKIILIEGAALSEYMIENNVGVTVEATYELKRIDSDYFSDD